MPYITAKTARINSANELAIYNEVDAISRAVLQASANNLYEASVNNSPMTSPTRIVTITATETFPTITLPASIVINGTTVDLTTGASVFEVAYDISSTISNVSATVVGGKLTLEYRGDSTNSTIEIVENATTIELGLPTGLFQTSNNSGYLYAKSFEGTMSSRLHDEQMNSVIDFFKQLGYNISRQLNNNNNNDNFLWRIYW